jgi:hypothetical protein
MQLEDRLDTHTCLLLAALWSSYLVQQSDQVSPEQKELSATIQDTIVYLAETPGPLTGIAPAYLALLEADFPAAQRLGEQAVALVEPRT